MSTVMMTYLKESERILQSVNKLEMYLNNIKRTSENALKSYKQVFESGKEP